MNINKCVDKAWETRSLKDIQNAPPSALQGLTPEHDKLLAQLHIKTIRDLGDWKFAAWARALNELAKLEE